MTCGIQGAFKERRHYWSCYQAASRLRWCVFGHPVIWVPKESVPINRELIFRKRISLSFLLWSCLLSSICSTFLTSRQWLMPSCCNISSLAIFRLAFLGTCGSSSPFAKSIFQVHSPFFSDAPDFLIFSWLCCWFVIENYFDALEFRPTTKWLLRGLWKRVCEFSEVADFINGVSC